MNKEILRAYFIAGPQDFPGETIDEAKLKISRIIQSGVTAFQFRDKGTVYQNDYQRIKLAQDLREIAQQAKVTFIMNDAVQLSILTQADGLHIGQDDEQLYKAREMVGNEMIIGLSVRNEQELLLAQDSIADYLGIGPIYPTQSKSDASESIGLVKLSNMLNKNNLPIVGIGGIDLAKIPELSKTAIDGVAIISLLTKAKQPNEVVNVILKHFLLE
ncbi:thiamine phosphate synthase [Lactovum miscens]|uniref:Thiamine-phosphate synthase n=1 Tax=Lactovum miscens TaxID=190387 RepID=A0A841C8T4_9LACT|nr:thiamine phosphate synthase [Lactovum miscens]MBB5888754.1 thiamine-phosphate pyrophosphorylase [Lactovum miscens]